MFSFTMLDKWRSKIRDTLKINSVNPLYLIFSNENWCFEEINGNKHLTLVPTNESKEKIKKNRKNCGVKSEIYLGFIIKNSDDYDEKYIKIKFNSDSELLVNKTIEILSMIIVVRVVFLENKKYYPQVF